MRAILLLIFVFAALMLLSSCGSSARNGVGPYDFTDYDMLDAREELREAQWEMTKYPYESIYDDLADQQATEAAQDALSEYLYEEYLREKYGE